MILLTNFIREENMKNNRSENFFEYKCSKQKERIKQLERECADLQVKNQELSERCKKLASRIPEWPKGFKPRRKTPFRRAGETSST